MPYPIPDDLNEIEGWRWYLVPLPDNDQMIRVAWGMFSELTNYWMWGEEGPVPVLSNQAAQIWADALYEAFRVRAMGFPENLLAAIDEIEPLLRQLSFEQACCEWIPGGDEVIAGTEGDLEESDTDITAEVFPPGIADEGEMRSYLCGAATALVDQLIATPDRVATYASWSISGLIVLILWYTGGAFLAIAGAGVLGGLLTLPAILDALDLLASLKEAVDNLEEPAPSVIEAELTAARDDLICAVVTSNTAVTAGAALRSQIAAAVTSTAWQNVLFIMTRDSVLARVFNGSSDAPEGSCPSCICDEFSMQTGSPITNTTFNSAVAGNGQHAVALKFNHNGTSYCGPLVEIDAVSVSHNFTQILGRDQSGATVFNSETPQACGAEAGGLVGEHIAELIVLISDDPGAAACFSPFVLTVERHDV